MPTTIGEVINNLAQKAGVLADNPELKTLLSSPELANIQVPDALVTTFDSGLLSIEAAKNDHPEIKKVYTAKAYNGMDKHLLTLIESDTFDAADLDEIKREPSTSKKYELVISKLKAAKAAAKGADKEEINKQLTEAHAAAKAAKDEVTKVRSEYEGKIHDIQLRAAIKAVFGNYKTIYDDMDPAVKSISMESLITKALQDKNAVLKTDENGNLQLTSKDGTNVFGSNNVQLTPNSFLDQTFAPILKVANTKQPIAPQTRPTVQTAATPAEVNLEANVSQIKSHADKVIADMAAAPVNMI